jgi:hypothetical protein
LRNQAGPAGAVITPTKAVKMHEHEEVRESSPRNVVAERDVTVTIATADSQRSSVDAAYERLNEVSFSRSVQKLRRNYSLRVVSSLGEEGLVSRAS